MWQVVVGQTMDGEKGIWWDSQFWGYSYAEMRGMEVVGRDPTREVVLYNEKVGQMVALTWDREGERVRKGPMVPLLPEMLTLLLKAPKPIP